MRTPEDVLREAFEADRQRQEGLKILREKQTAADEAKNALKTAEATALLNVQGTVPEKQAQVVLACQAEREAAAAAEAEIHYVKETLRQLSDRISLLQSELRWMRELGA